MVDGIDVNEEAGAGNKAIVNDNNSDGWQAMTVEAVQGRKRERESN